MRLPYDLIILDLEFNQPSKKLIELGAVKLFRDGGITKEDTFSELIQIDEPVSDYIVRLTGIDDKMLKKEGKPFTEVALRFHNWAISKSKNIVLASWGGGDIPALRKAYEDNLMKYPFRGKTFDAKSIAVWMSCMCGKRTNKGGDGLGTLLKAWQIKFEGNRHRAKDDALMTAILLQTIWKEFEHWNEKTIHYAKKMLGVK